MMKKLMQGIDTPVGAGKMIKERSVETDMNQYGSLRNHENVHSKSPYIKVCFIIFIGTTHDRRAVEHKA